VLPLVVYWRVQDELPVPGLQFQLDLAGPDGALAPLDTFLLPAGPVVRLPRSVLVPPDAPAGQGTVRVRLLDAAGRTLAGPAALGSLEVTAPVRSFDRPPIETPLSVRFGEGIELLGYDLGAGPVRAGESLPLTLYWRSAQRVTVRYAVFVHLLDTAGRLAAQVDSPPLSGTRPTTGWLPPEILVDPYSLVVPADSATGDYVLQVGLYDPITGVRLGATGPEGEVLGDAVVLDAVIVSTAP
jgi:hypothetical protein